MSLCASAEAHWIPPLENFLSSNGDVLSETVELMREAVSLSHPKSLAWNAIDVHEAMTADPDLGYCAAAFGYATYGENDRPYRLSFASFPGLRSPHEAGTMIGGAGVGLSAACVDRDLTTAFLGYLASEPAQSLLRRTTVNPHSPHVGPIP